MEEVRDSLLVLPVHLSIGHWLARSPEELRGHSVCVDLSELRGVERSTNQLLGDGLTVSLVGDKVSGESLLFLKRLHRVIQSLGSADQMGLGNRSVGLRK